MKHTQLILAAALVALAGCSKENIDLTGQNSLDNEIGFTAVTKKATKANNAIISGTTYEHDNTFQVWGWQSAKDGNSGENIAFSDLSEGANSNFMSNLTIEWTKGRDANSTTKVEAWRNKDNYYYWPFTGKISFLALHPSTVAPTTTGWDATNKKPQATINDYTIRKDDTTTTDVNEDNSTTDLMFAIAAGSRNAGLDGQGRLGLVFKHALSQIVVKAKTDEDYTLDDVQFDLESVQFNNIDLSGDLAYANETFTWTDNTAASQTENWMYYNTVLANVVKDAQQYGQPVLMIPQPANVLVWSDPVGDPSDPDNYTPAQLTDAVQTTLTIGYSMKQKNNAKITGTVTVAAPWAKVKQTEGETVTPYDPAEAISGWEAGKKYVYTLNFKLKEILFNPTVTDWVEVEMQTINILD